jgi:hypothetical protein
VFVNTNRAIFKKNWENINIGRQNFGKLRLWKPQIL